MLGMAKSKTHGCDAHSTRCTQLLIVTVLAVAQDGELYIFEDESLAFVQSKEGFGREPRDLTQAKGTGWGRKHYRWDCLHYRRSPTSTATMQYTP